AQTKDSIQHLGDDEREDEGEDRSHHDSDQLRHELAWVAVENPSTRCVDGWTGEDACCQRTPDTGHPMATPNVERFIQFAALDEFDRVVADRSADGTDYN